MKNQPIIIVGMHRSGTSMLTRFISDLNVFMGKDKSENDESSFFQNINRWILFQAGASWDVPEPINLIDSKFNDIGSKVVYNRLNSLWSKEYLGIKNYIKYHKITNIKGNWGWKDPRNTLLLPLYKKIYPNAKIVHIYRNPIDVAVSLQTREFKKKEQIISFKDKIKMQLLYKQRLINHSFVVEDLLRGVKLWEFYTKKALEADTLFNSTIHIKYEDFLNNPKPILHELTKFLEIKTDVNLIEKVTQKVDFNRAFAFQKNEAHLKFYKQVKERPLLKTLGYNTL